MAKGSRGGRRRGNTGGDGRFGTVNRLPLAGQTKFTNGNQTSVGATLDDWEGKRGDLDHEQLLLIDSDGYAVGYFDGDKQSVAFFIPKGQDPKNLTLTHVHPTSGDARTIGGSFSNADIENHIEFGFKETRATATEGTYSFKTTSESNPKGFLKALQTRQTEVGNAVDKAVSDLRKKGHTLTESEHTDLYLKLSDAWYRQNAYLYGYEYTFTKRS